MRSEVFTAAGVLRHLEALGRLVQFRSSLRRQGWRVTLDRSRSLADDLGNRHAGSSAQARRNSSEIERSLWRASRLVPGVTCIHRALAAQTMLRRRGFKARVVIGLRKGSGPVEGHAWVEVGQGESTQRLFWSDDAGYIPIANRLDDPPHFA